MISRELQVLNTFRSAYNELPPLLDRHGLVDIAEASRTFGDALIQLGRCERLARQFERNRVVSGAKEAKNELATVVGLNKRGQAALKQAIDQISRAGNKVTSADEKKNLPALKSGLAEFSEVLMSLLAECEIKPSDLIKLKGIHDEVMAVAIGKGESGLIEHMLTNMEKLAELRDRPDRGAVDNIPWWKIVAIAVALGLAAISVYRCINRGRRCSDTTQAALAIGMTIASVVIYFC